MINTSLLRFGGAVQVALSLVHECRNWEQHEFHVIVGPGLAPSLDVANFPPNFTFYHKSFGVMGVRQLPRVQLEMAALEEQISPDCVLTTSGPSYWRSRAPHVIGFNRPLFIYPESPYVTGMSTAARLRLVAQKSVHCWLFRRDADALIVQTDDVNQRVRKLLGIDETYTVTNTHNAWYDLPPSGTLRLPPRREGAFRLLTISSYYPHKNLEIVPQIIDLLPHRILERVEFVLTLTEEEFRRRIGSRIPSQVRLIGGVPPPECPALYAECDAMFLPTLAECFSASYPEAMKMAKPIVTTDLGFARGICGDAALYFRARDPRAAAAEIIRLMESPALQEELRQAGLQRLSAFDTPRQRAEKVLMICGRVSRRKETPKTRRTSPAGEGLGGTGTARNPPRAASIKNSVDERL